LLADPPSNETIDVFYIKIFIDGRHKTLDSYYILWDISKSEYYPIHPSNKNYVPNIICVTEECQSSCTQYRDKVDLYPP